MGDFLGEGLCREDRALVRRALTRLAEGPTIIKVNQVYLNMTYVTIVKFTKDALEECVKVWQVGDEDGEFSVTHDPSEIAVLRAWTERGMG